MTSRYKFWTRRTKISLVISFMISFLLAVMGLYVWPGQLYAILIGVGIFVFLLLFNPRGVVLGTLGSVLLFLLLIPFSEGVSSVRLPILIIMFLVIATSEKLMSR